jgi:3-phenylpropionate/trans-cinnamate dioxygenase ferredoxin reductase subunit
LRDEGFQGQVHLFDGDKHGAYERPPLSKAVLIEPEKQANDIALITPARLDELNITAYWGELVVRIDTEIKTLTTKSGLNINADAIVMATGGKARKLPLPGADAQGVYVVRDYDDAAAIKRALKSDTAVTVIGGGFIGAEVVASLLVLGHRVTWLDVAPQPLAHVLPTAICEPLLAWFAGHENLTIKGSAQISKLGIADGELVSVDLEGGESIATDMVIMGVGMMPKAELGESAGLDIALSGIRVNHNFCTSKEGIYACGDVAVFERNGSLHREEHWQAAQHQGGNVARAIMAKPLLPDPVPWFWSDQGPHHIEMAGRKGDRTIVRAEGDWPVAFEFEGSQLVGVVSVNNPNAVRIGMRLLKKNIQIPESELADPAINMRDFLKR